jgi:hypothetical protein
VEESLLKDERACIVTCVLGGYRLPYVMRLRSGRIGISGKTDIWCIVQWHQKRESVAKINGTSIADGGTKTFFSVR